MIESILYVSLVLGGLIFFHELGHFLMARAFGMGVTTFSLGFGPKLLKKTVGKTEYCLSIIPLGGYCALVDEDKKDNLPEGFTEKESFALRPAWQRLLVVVAGPLANILLAWIICWGLAVGYGQKQVLPIVESFANESVAKKAGMQVKDKIISINGVKVEDWDHMSTLIAGSKGKSMLMQIERKGKMFDMNFAAKTHEHKNIFGETIQSYVIGIHSSPEVFFKPVSFMDGAKVGAIRAWDMLVISWTGFVKLVQNVVPFDQVGGPILIVQLIGKQADQGLEPVLALAAFISINLGILNLLPIPLLDGGHIVFFTLEIIFRRPVPDRIKNFLSQIGFFILIALMVLTTFNDVWRLIKEYWM